MTWTLYFLTQFQTSFLSVLFITALGMLLYSFGNRFDDNLVSTELIFAGSVIAIAFWVSAYTYMRQEPMHVHADLKVLFLTFHADSTDGSLAIL